MEKNETIFLIICGVLLLSSIIIRITTPECEEPKLIIERIYNHTAIDNITRQCVEREVVTDWDYYGRPTKSKIVYRSCMPIE